MKKIFRDYSISTILIFTLCLTTQFLLSDAHTLKWTALRYCVILSLVLPLIISKFNTTKNFWFQQIIIFIITGVSVPLFFRLGKNLNVDGAFVWDELSVSLSIIFMFLSLKVMLELLLESHKKIKDMLVTILLFIQFIPYLAGLSYFVLTGDFIDVNSLVALYQTNLNESLEFFSSSINPITAIILIIFIILLFALLFILNSSLIVNYKKIRNTSNIIFVILLSVTSVILFHKVSGSMYFNKIISHSQDYIHSIIEYKQQREDVFNNENKINVNISGIPNNATFLVVIGESQNKNHMSSYGYMRNTTPWSKKMLSDDNFIFFDNAYACHTLTMKALSQALTESNQYNNKPFAKSYSLVDIANAAGFETYWISNQSKFGAFSTPVSVMAEMADYQIWLNSDDTTNIVHDGDILLHLDKVKKTDGKKVVFIHLMGNHWEYWKRYPKEFNNNFIEDRSNILAKAKNKTKLNEYDSSMVYNDYVIEKIFEYAKKNWNLYNMVYFSDHGEAVLSDNKHIPGKFEIDMVQIPVYFYCSDEYKTLNNDKFKSFKERNKVFFTNDMMFDTILNVWNVKTDIYDSKYDIISNNFNVSKKELRSLEGNMTLFN